MVPVICMYVCVQNKRRNIYTERTCIKGTSREVGGNIVYYRQYAKCDCVRMHVCLCTSIFLTYNML